MRDSMGLGTVYMYPGNVVCMMWINTNAVTDPG